MRMIPASQIWREVVCKGEVPDDIIKLTAMLTKSQIKYIQSLGHKKFRDEESLFIVEGPRILEEWLNDKKVAFQAIYALQEWIDRNPHANAIPVTEAELEKISQLKQPHEVLAVVKKWTARQPDTSGEKWILALDTIQDPGNMGTIIRIADWFGVEHIICQKDGVDVYNPKVVQGTMGSLARVNIVYDDLAEWLKQHRDLRVYAADLEGQDVKRADAAKKGVLVIGNEARGICDAVMQLVNVRVTIPRKGGAESLNAAVATGILLSHLV